MKTARHTSSYAWFLIALLWVVAMLNYLDRQVIFSLFPPLQKEFGVSSVQLGLISTVFLWVYGALSPVKLPAEAGTTNFFFLKSIALPGFAWIK